MGISTDHLVANGTEGLEQVLGQILDKTRENPAMAGQAHYILYQLGSQKSLIKIDTLYTPFRFWYYDLMGRPATTAVKEVIARFIWEKCGEQHRVLDADN